VALTWDQWIDRNRAKFDSDYELDFAAAILSKIPDLAPVSVSCQTWVTQRDGGNRCIDFTIAEGRYVRIAIEVDGYSKDGTPGGQSFEQYLDAHFRDMSLATTTWGIPLHIANRHIRTAPETVRETIDLKLKAQRRLAEALEAGEVDALLRKHAKDALIEEARSEGELDQTREAKLFELYERGEIESLSNEDQNRRNELRDQIRRLNEELKREKEDRNRAEIERDEAKRGRDETVKENRGMRTGWLISVICLVVGMCLVVALFLLLGGNNDASGSQCDDANAAGDLTLEDVGEIVNVKGQIAQISKVNEATFLNLGGPYGAQDLAVVIWGGNLENWATPPDVKYDGREVSVTGKVDLYDDPRYGESLEIEANSPNDIAICS